MDREVGEAAGRGPRGTPRPLSDEDQVSGTNGLSLAVHLYGTGTRDAHQEDVHLVVDVFFDAASGVEADEVRVEVAAPFEGPDRTLPVSGRREHLPQIHVSRTSSAKDDLLRVLPRPLSANPRPAAILETVETLSPAETLPSGWSKLVREVSKSDQDVSLGVAYSRGMTDLRRCSTGESRPALERVAGRAMRPDRCLVARGAVLDGKVDGRVGGSV